MTMSPKSILLAVAVIVVAIMAREQIKTRFGF